MFESVRTFLEKNAQNTAAVKPVLLLNILSLPSVFALTFVVSLINIAIINYIPNIAIILFAPFAALGKIPFIAYLVFLYLLGNKLKTHWAKQPLPRSTKIKHIFIGSVPIILYFLASILSLFFYTLTHQTTDEMGFDLLLFSFALNSLAHLAFYFIIYPIALLRK